MKEMVNKEEYLKDQINMIKNVQSNTKQIGEILDLIRGLNDAIEDLTALYHTLKKEEELQ